MSGLDDCPLIVVELREAWLSWVLPGEHEGCRGSMTRQLEPKALSVWACQKLERPSCDKDPCLVHWTGRIIVRHQILFCDTLRWEVVTVEMRYEII